MPPRFCTKIPKKPRFERGHQAIIVSVLSLFCKHIFPIRCVALLLHKFCLDLGWKEVFYNESRVTEIRIRIITGTKTIGYVPDELKFTAIAVTHLHKWIISAFTVLFTEESHVY